MNLFSALLLASLIVLATRARPYAVRYELRRFARQSAADKAKEARCVDALATAQEMRDYGFITGKEYGEAWIKARRDVDCDAPELQKMLQHCIQKRHRQRIDAANQEWMKRWDASRVRGKENHARTAALLESSYSLAA